MTAHSADPVSDVGPRRRPRFGMRALVVVLVLLGAPRLLFPGDVPFIADEPLIVERALDALDAGTLPTAGLQGTRGATYGPAPTWFYQATLSITSDLRWVALAKVALTTLLTGLALVILAGQVAGLSPVLGAFAFLSPYLWFYSRDLWDNSFAVPFSAMLLAAYVAFWATDRVRWLAWAGLFGTLCLLTHLMTAPLVAAVGLHFLMRRGRELLTSRTFAVKIGAVAVGCLALALPYLGELSAGSATSLLWSPSPRSLAFGLDGFRIFSLVGFDYVVGAWGATEARLAMEGVSAFTYAAGAWGLFLVNRELRRTKDWTSAHGDAADAPTTVSGDDGVTGRSPAIVRSELARVLALALVLFVVVANGKRLVEHPHYYSGVWIVFFCLWWMGMSELAHRVWARRVWYAQVAVMAFFLPGVAVWLHVGRGTKSLHYGPTLDNQMEVARELDRLGVEEAPPSAAHHPRLFPQAIRALRRLNARGGDGPVVDVEQPPGRYEIVYTEPDGPGGEIIVRRTDHDGPPSGAWRVP